MPGSKLETVKTSADQAGTTSLQTILETKQLMKSGPFEGQPCDDVAERAIRWWQERLDEIDAQIAAKRNSEN